MQRWKKYILITDILALYLSLVLALMVRGAIYSHVDQNTAVWLAAHSTIFLPSVLFSLLALYVASLYDAKTIYNKSNTVVLLLYAQFSAALFSILTFYFFKTELTPKLTLALYVVISIVLLSFTRTQIFRTLQNSKKPLGYFLSDSEKDHEKLLQSYAPFDLKRVSSLEEIKDLKPTQIPVLIFDKDKISSDNFLNLENLKQKNILVYSYEEYFEFLFKKIDLEKTKLSDLVKLFATYKESRAHFIFRKYIDISCGLFIYPFYLLSLPFVKIGYLLEEGSGGASIYSKQDRVGFLGNQVWLWKIRTMTYTETGGLMSKDVAKSGQNQSGNRYTRFGMFLRKSRVDELPQCLNLLKGEISLIGPRANIIGVHTDMCKQIPDYSLRLLVPQGLTGWAQVHMNIQPKTLEEVLERTAYDLYYVKYRSIFLDISIILKTIKTILSREGA